MTLEWLLIVGAIAGIAAGSVLAVSRVVEHYADPNLPDAVDVVLIDAEIAAANATEQGTCNDLKARFDPRVVGFSWKAPDPPDPLDPPAPPDRGSCRVTRIIEAQQAAAVAKTMAECDALGSPDSRFDSTVVTFSWTPNELVCKMDRAATSA